jgi:hypothetical protein
VITEDVRRNLRRYGACLLHSRCAEGYQQWVLNDCTRDTYVALFRHKLTGELANIVRRDPRYTCPSSSTATFPTARVSTADLPELCYGRAEFKTRNKLRANSQIHGISIHRLQERDRQLKGPFIACGRNIEVSVMLLKICSWARYD